MGQEEELFLDKTEPVWTPASPREAKLVGVHTHAFTIAIPRDALVAPMPKATPKRFPLPPTFSERASPTYIDYNLYVTVRRGALRVNNKCVFNYFIHCNSVLQQSFDSSLFFHPSCRAWRRLCAQAVN